jgi:hypothetical protein
MARGAEGDRYPAGTVGDGLVGVVGPCGEDFRTKPEATTRPTAKA